MELQYCSSFFSIKIYTNLKFFVIINAEKKRKEGIYMKNLVSLVAVTHTHTHTLAFLINKNSRFFVCLKEET